MINLQNCVFLTTRTAAAIQAGKNIYGLSRDEQRNNAKGYGQRQRQQDCDRVNEGFKLRRQHHVHENKDSTKASMSSLARPSSFERPARPVE